MADLSIDFCGIRSPNPFWLASAPPTNTGDQVMRAFDAGWGGAVWKTLGNPIVNVSSRFGGIDYGNTRLVGLNNIELITDRPLEVNLREIREVKRRYPKHTVIASLMVETKEEWREIIQKAEDAGADGLELNFGCPHGMCERGMGSAVGNEPKVLEEIARWAVDSPRRPVIVKLTPNIGDITEPGEAVVRSGAHAISLINTVKSIMGVDLDRMVPLPRVGGASTNGGYCGPAVKPIALHLLSQLARHPRDPEAAHLGHRRHRELARRGRVHRAGIDQRAGVHGGDALRLPHRRGHDRGAQRLPRRAGDDVGERAPRPRGAATTRSGATSTSPTGSSPTSIERKCIGCQLCYVACMDGAHQCIHLPGRTRGAGAGGRAHAHPGARARAGGHGAGRAAWTRVCPSWTRTSASAATSARWCARWRAAST